MSQITFLSSLLFSRLISFGLPAPPPWCALRLRAPHNVFVARSRTFRKSSYVDCLIPSGPSERASRPPPVPNIILFVCFLFCPWLSRAPLGVTSFLIFFRPTSLERSFARSRSPPNRYRAYSPFPRVGPALAFFFPSSGCVRPLCSPSLYLLFFSDPLFFLQQSHIYRTLVSILDGMLSFCRICSSLCS